MIMMEECHLKRRSGPYDPEQDDPPAAMPVAEATPQQPHAASNAIPDVAMTASQSSTAGSDTSQPQSEKSWAVVSSQDQEVSLDGSGVGSSGGSVAGSEPILLGRRSGHAEARTAALEPRLKERGIHEIANSLVSMPGDTPTTSVSWDAASSSISVVTLDDGHVRALGSGSKPILTKPRSKNREKQ